MIRWIKRGALYLLFVLDPWMYIRKIPLLNKFKPGIYFETNIYGTKISMIDDRTFDYYTHISQGKIYEPALTLQLKTLFKDYDFPTFVDIGAHYGYFTIYAGKLIGSRGQVISIEPHKKYYIRLLKNIQINGLKENIRTFNLALSDKEGQANMEGWDERVLHEVGNGDVQVITFDQLCKRENIQPDIIKIDVHGAKGKVLAGMLNTLKNKVSHLFCELHDDLLGYTIREIIQILEATGLEVFEFTKHREVSGGKLIPISGDFLSHYDDRMRRY